MAQGRIPELPATAAILALRGYVHRVQEPGPYRRTDLAVALLKRIAPCARRPEEKRLVIAALAELRSPEIPALLESFADDSAVADDVAKAQARVQERTPRK